MLENVVHVAFDLMLGCCNLSDDHLWYPLLFQSNTFFTGRFLFHDYETLLSYHLCNVTEKQLHDPNLIIAKTDIVHTILANESSTAAN